MNNLFATKPAAVSDKIRNLVIARAIASAYNGETEKQAVAACRAAARHAIGCDRLNPTQATEVDAIAVQARQRALAGTAEAPVASAMERVGADSTALAVQQNAESTKAILAAVLRIEKMLIALFTVLVKRWGASPSESDARLAPQGRREYLTIGGQAVGQSILDADFEITEGPRVVIGAPPAARALPLPQGERSLAIYRN